MSTKTEKKQIKHTFTREEKFVKSKGRVTFYAKRRVGNIFPQIFGDTPSSLDADGIRELKDSIERINKAASLDPGHDYRVELVRVEVTPV